MAIFKKIQGIVGSIFRIGGPAGVGLKYNSDVLEVRNAADDGFAVSRTGMIPASGQTVNDAVSLLALQGRVADIVYSFDGASPPTAGVNTGAFGFCHTAGGSYSAGEVVYDTGTALQKIPASVVKAVTTRSAVTGTVSLNANGYYVNQGGTWTLKGDGTGVSVGMSQWISIIYDFEDTTVSSTTSVPDGAAVVRVANAVSVAFNGTSPTVQVVIDGTSDEEILATGDSDLTAANQYESDEIHAITSSTEGVVKLTVTPDSSTSGAGIVYVEYTTPSA